MSDFEDSDEERYANESFENETDNEVPEISEIESEASENSDDNRMNEREEEEVDDDEDDLPSVKINTGPIRRKSFAKNFTNLHKTDAIPFASSSDEEDDVIVGQTLAEINTPSMNFIDEPQKPTVRQFVSVVRNETHIGSSDEISEEENDEDEEAEFKRIQEMEEKYILQNSAKTPKLAQTISQENEEEKLQNPSEEEYESDIEDEDQLESQDYELQEYMQENNVNASQELTNANFEKLEAKDYFQEEQNDKVEVMENTLTNLKLLATQDSETTNSSLETNEMLQTPLTDDNIDKVDNASTVMNSDETNTTDVSAPNSTVPVNPHNINYNNEQEIEKQNDEPNVNGKDLIEHDQEIEVERSQNNADNVADSEHNYDEDEDEIYYNDQFDYRITSKTPTSFNSDDYIFHANFIKQFHRTNSTDKLRPKPHPRKSMSFSNERMREIERHNQILLRKILTQKPTYNLSKPSQTSLQKKASTHSNARLTTSAVNRKKQQKQIDMDNQILKRKIEAIGMRRRPLIS